MTIPVVTVEELLTAGADGTVAFADKYADHTRGSDLDVLSGPNAIIGARQHQRDRDLFRAIHMYSARGDDLSKIVRERYGIERDVDSAGTGSISIRRPSTAGGAGTIYRGTRFAIVLNGYKVFRTTSDVTISATDLAAELPIESLETGPGAVAETGYNIQIQDPVFDATFVAVYLKCGPGAEYEQNASLLNRVRQEKLDRRVGHETAITKFCLDAGATYVACFRSNYAGDAYDFGLNYVYVGDSGYSGSPSLLRACQKALYSCRVFGDNLQVLPMARQDLVVSASVVMSKPLTALSMDGIKQAVRASVSKYFGGVDGGWVYTIQGLKSAIATASLEVRQITIDSPVSDSSIISVDHNFPAVLNRYFARQINITYSAP